jgi:hypothetical protein
MPTTISDFNSSIRNLRARILVDLGGGLVDYTGNLDNYTVLTELNNDNDIAGLFDTVFDAQFFIPSPGIEWTKSGLKVQAYISTSSDNWTTSIEKPLFIGSTIKSNSFPINEIKIRATTFLSNFLDQKPTRFVYESQTINYIIDDLLRTAGVTGTNISINTSQGSVLQYYIRSQLKTYRDIINDLLKADLKIGGFDGDNIFRIRSIVPLLTSYTPDNDISLNTIIDFGSRDITSKFYANTLQINGQYQVAIQPDPISGVSELYYNNLITNVEIKAGEKLFYQIPMGNIVPINLGNGVNSHPNSVLNSSYSYYGFKDIDDGSGSYNATEIYYQGSVFEYDSTKKIEVVKLVFYNNGTTSKFLKFLKIRGQGYGVTPANLVNFENTFLKNNDGQEILKTIESTAIQSEQQAQTLQVILQRNFQQNQDVYLPKIKGRPTAIIGSTMRIRDRYDNIIDTVVCSVDTVISIDQGFEQNIICKKIDISAQYAGFDNPSIGWDNSAYRLL